MAQHPRKPTVYGRHHKGSPKIFLVIYLLVALAIAASVILLKPDGDSRSIDEILASEKAAAEIARKTEAPSPKPKPPKPETKPKPKPKAKPETMAKVENGNEEPPETPATEPGEKTDPEPPEPTLSAEDEKQIEWLYPFPEIPPLMEYVNNWDDVPQRAFPKLVAIRKPVDFDMVQGGQVVARGKLPAGSMMVPVQLNGEQLVLSGGGASPITVTVPVEDTDFKELIQTRYETFVEAQKAQVVAQRKAERDRRLGAITHEQSLTDWNDGSDPRFDPIKASLQRGDASVYSLADASKWRWGGTENIAGNDYETAFVVIVSEAAFGVTEVELKVLMQEGKVVRWLDPATGDEI